MGVRSGASVILGMWASGRTAGGVDTGAADTGKSTTERTRSRVASKPPCGAVVAAHAEWR